jgi:outer membrane immunogenic protein
MRNPKLIFSAAVAISAIAGIGAASAADLPARVYTKAPAVVASPIYDWSGFYIGLNGGWGSSRNCWDLTANGLAPIVPATPEGCHNATGGAVGGQAGYRWQSSAWVFGLEAQGDWANLRGTTSPSLTFLNTANTSKINAFGLFTGQVGYAWNNVLVYVKGGAAVTSDKYEGRVINIANNVLFDTAAETRWGGVAGVGLEFGFAPNWSVAAEYDHLFMGSHSDTFTAVGFLATAGIVTRSDNIRQDVDLVTVRVNYRFGGPVVAKY